MYQDGTESRQILQQEKIRLVNSCEGPESVGILNEHSRPIFTSVGSKNNKTLATVDGLVPASSTVGVVSFLFPD